MCTCLRAPKVSGSEAPGVHGCLHRSLMRSDRDLRATLYKQIVLAGGSTLLKVCVATTQPVTQARSVK